MSGGKVVDYNTWSKEDLIDKIRKLEIHVTQLRNIINNKSIKQTSSGTDYLDHPRKRLKLEGGDDDSLLESQPCSSYKKDKNKVHRKFDFSTVAMRHVALKILYLGWDYQGLAAQEDTDETIEAHLFKALTMTKLIEERAKSNYHRCGRTDKGVSAFSQVISIDLRSKTVDGHETMDYCKILNRTLPKEIRVIAWSPLVQPDFSARFNCSRRTYKYFFPKGNLNIEKMLQGAQYLVGEHDFINFCKLDKDLRSTVRNIFSVSINKSSHSANGGADNMYDIYHLEINGASFVWHQIRCIVGILLLIGQELEEPEVVQKLLDHCQKPQYSMAIDYPLVLYDVDYPVDSEIKWTYTPENMTCLLSQMQNLWVEFSIKSEMILSIVKDIENLTEIRKPSMTESLIMGTKRKIYAKILDRPVCPNYERLK